MRILTERRKQIVGLIVDEYIAAAEPVGSEVLARKYKLGVSSATIRNEMAQLERLGLISQPYTSAGRVPTDKGYRFYVDYLMELEELTENEKRAINRQCQAARLEVEAIIRRTCKLLSYLTNYTSIVTVLRMAENVLQQAQIQDLFDQLPAHEERILRHALAYEGSKRIYLDGSSCMFEQPEFRDLDKLRSIMKRLEEENTIFEIFSKVVNQQRIVVTIGSENKYLDLWDCSVIATPYIVGPEVAGAIGIIGPKRMKYSRTIPKVKWVAKSLGNLLTESCVG